MLMRSYISQFDELPTRLASQVTEPAALAGFAAEPPKRFTSHIACIVVDSEGQHLASALLSPREDAAKRPLSERVESRSGHKEWLAISSINFMSIAVNPALNLLIYSLYKYAAKNGISYYYCAGSLSVHRILLASGCRNELVLPSTPSEYGNLAFRIPVRGADASAFLSQLPIKERSRLVRTSLDDALHRGEGNINANETEKGSKLPSPGRHRA